MAKRKLLLCENDNTFSKKEITFIEKIKCDLNLGESKTCESNNEGDNSNFITAIKRLSEEAAKQQNCPSHFEIDNVLDDLGNFKGTLVDKKINRCADVNLNSAIFTIPLEKWKKMIKCRFQNYLITVTSFYKNLENCTIAACQPY